MYYYEKIDLKKTAISLGVIVIVYFLTSIIAVYFPVELIRKTDYVKINVTFNAAFSTIMLIVTVYLMRHNLAESMKNVTEYKATNTIKWLLYGLMLCYLAEILATVIRKIIGLFCDVNFIGGNQQAIYRSFSEFPFLISVFVLVAPIYEELIFRGMLFRVLKEKTTFLIALIGSAAAFGMIHVTSEIISGNISMAITNSLLYFSLGIALALFYEKRRNISLCIATHFFINLIALINIVYRGLK
jgi:membrane protease YdiL (CAAX protease family)